MSLKIFIPLILLITLSNISFSQTFDCYITNDTLVSETQFEFEVYIKSTSEDFLFRTIQLSFNINPEFTPKGTQPIISYVEGSSKLKKFSPGNFRQNSSPTLSAFQMSSSPSFSCDKGSLITKKAILIGRFRIESQSGKFNKVSPDIKMINPKESPPGGEVNLKMAISKWSTNDCSLPTAKLISNSGKYFTK